MKKRFVAALLSLLVAFAFLPANVLALESSDTIEDFALKSSGKNVDDLVDYIITKGIYEDNSVHIEKDYSLEYAKARGLIYYSHPEVNEEFLHFEFSMWLYESNSWAEDKTSEPFGVLTASFDYDIKLEKEQSSILVSQYLSSGELHAAKADFIIATYNPETTSLAFKDISSNEYVSKSDNNYYIMLVKQASTIWNGMLQSLVGMQLNDIGFLSYQSNTTTNPPTEPNPPVQPTTPENLSLFVSNGSLGKKITAQITGGHWLTVQTKRGASIAISSIQAPGSGTVTLAFSAAAGSSIQVWETETEMTFNAQGIPNNKILATASRTL